MFKRIIFFFLILLLNEFNFAQKVEVLTGIDVLKLQNFEILKNKKIGLITNQTGVDKNLKSTIDILYQNPQVNLIALFAPEHGIRGEKYAGENVKFYFDSLTNLPVYSLYGKNKKPSPEILKNLDALVYDIQDIGVRSYTYISTMGLAMEAAAENGIEFIILDRPNPLGGIKIEGNLVEDKFVSFIGQYKIPYVYGLTCGELANFLNKEKYLSGGIKCDLKIVKMQGWKRKMLFKDTKLIWVPTSPHIPTETSAQFYAATGILGELGIISEGVGYTLPFQILAAEWINGNLLVDELKKIRLKGFNFRPVTFKPFYGKYSGKILNGVQIFINDFESANLISLQFKFLEIHNKLYPEKNPFELSDSSRISMFDKAIGTDMIRKVFTQKFLYGDIENYLEKDIENFRRKSIKYYLYN